MVFVGELCLLKSADGFGVEHATVSMVRGNEIKVRSSATATPRSPAGFPLGTFQSVPSELISVPTRRAPPPRPAVLPRTLAGAAPPDRNRTPSATRCAVSNPCPSRSPRFPHGR